MAAKKVIGKTVHQLPLENLTSFTKDGREFQLNEPEGEPSAKMLFALLRSGHLAITVEAVEPFNKGQASFALSSIPRR